ncbi:DUF2917 domain-containing protein [Ramlibacter sp.]|uniref:DUF2917 domain-containing protein n=1 Tax=Ramlibacter sp. TaxID=1917967 RepID=UPI0035ADA169
MTAAHSLQATPATALPGTWKLARGRAISLQPTTPGILRIAHGRVWATVDGPHGRTPWDSGDHVLEVGRSMWVRPGQRVVIEPWHGDHAAYFSWDPVTVPARSAQAVTVAQGDLQRVRQPLADLRRAAALGLRAGGQLVAGVAVLAWHLVTPRPAAPAACCAEGATG